MRVMVCDVTPTGLMAPIAALACEAVELTSAPLDPTCIEDLYDAVTATPEPFDRSGVNDDVGVASGIARSGSASRSDCAAMRF